MSTNIMVLLSAIADVHIDGIHNLWVLHIELIVITMHFIT